MAEPEPNELLIDENGNFVRGQEGGIRKVLERLDEIEAKVDILITKLPEAQKY